MEIYLDDLIAYKSLYLLMQKKTSQKENIEEQLLDLRNAAKLRCKKYAEYPMIEAKETAEETSLAPITEEIKIIKKIKNMLGHVRMFFNRNKSEKVELQETQQQAMVKLLLERYEKLIFAPKQIETVLGREIVMKVLGIDINEFMKDKTPERKISRENNREVPAMEH